MIRRPPARAWIGAGIFLLLGVLPLALFLAYHLRQEKLRRRIGLLPDDDQLFLRNGAVTTVNAPPSMKIPPIAQKM